jgi:hypothetical protein
MSIRFFVSLFFIFFLVPANAYADVIISEIMYDVPGSDTGREWIEVQNTGTAAEDISTWKLFENGIHHKITPLSSGLIPSGTYAIIADDPTAFRRDWPTYSGLLFDSAFSLKNTGEAVALKNASSTAVYETSYGSQRAKGDGNALNLVAGVFEARIPSPGAAPNHSAIVSKAKESKGNQTNVSAVQEDDSAGVPRAVSNTASVGASQEGEPSGMIPWALALLGVIALGCAALLFQGKPRGSGYSIIEEKQ